MASCPSGTVSASSHATSYRKRTAVAASMLAALMLTNGGAVSGSDGRVSRSARLRTQYFCTTRPTLVSSRPTASESSSMQPRTVSANRGSLAPKFLPDVRAGAAIGWAASDRLSSASRAHSRAVSASRAAMRARSAALSALRCATNADQSNLMAGLTARMVLMILLFQVCKLCRFAALYFTRVLTALSCAAPMVGWNARYYLLCSGLLSFFHCCPRPT